MRLTLPSPPPPCPGPRRPARRPCRRAAPSGRPTSTATSSALAGIAAANGGNRAAGLGPAPRRPPQYLADAAAAEAGWQVARQPVTFPFPFDAAPRRRSARSRHGRDFVVVRGSAAGRRHRAACARSSPSAASPRSLRRLERGEIALAARSRSCTPRRGGRSSSSARGGVGGRRSTPARTRSRCASSLAGHVADPGPRGPLDASAVRLSRPARADPRQGRRRHRARARRTTSSPSCPARRPRRHGRRAPRLGPRGARASTTTAAASPRCSRSPSACRGAARGTVRLGFWTAEEYGLYGSRALRRARSPPAERRRIARVPEPRHGRLAATASPRSTTPTTRRARAARARSRARGRDRARRRVGPRAVRARGDPGRRHLHRRRRARGPRATTGRCDTRAQRRPGDARARWPRARARRR